MDFAEEVKRYTLFELEDNTAHVGVKVRLIFDQIYVHPFLVPFIQLKNESGTTSLYYVREILKIPGEFGCTYVITSRCPIRGMKEFPEQYKLKCR